MSDRNDNNNEPQEKNEKTKGWVAQFFQKIFENLGFLTPLLTGDNEKLNTKSGLNSGTNSRNRDPQNPWEIDDENFNNTSEDYSKSLDSKSLNELNNKLNSTIQNPPFTPLASSQKANNDKKVEKEDQKFAKEINELNKMPPQENKPEP